MKRPLTLDSPYGAVTLGGTSENVARISSATIEGAFWALGWWQSRQRGDEALFARAFWRARLSDSPHANLGHQELDSLVRSWQVDRDLDLEAESLEAQDRAALHAFTRGFAAQQALRRTWPWTRSEISRSPWTAEDSILLARTLGLASWWETRGALARELLGWVQAGVSWSRLEELFPELGGEQARAPWMGLSSCPPWSEEAWSLVHRLHRWRPSLAFTAPAWGATYVCDVTEPGLPFLEVSIEGPGFSAQGLCLPGLPAFLAGRNERLAWHFQPTLGDIFHFGPTNEGTVAGIWVGAAVPDGEVPGSTLGALMAGPRASGADELAQTAHGQGLAALSLAALDREGRGAHVELGSRWQRQHPWQAWLPNSSFPTRVSAQGTSPIPPGPQPPAGQSPTYHAWQEHLTGTRDEQVDTLLPELRFLLPEAGDSRLLKTWSGTPTEGPQALLFQRLITAVWRAFWNVAQVDLPPDHPAAALLWKRVDTLVVAPHSAWLSARDKNQVLGEAVRTELTRPTPEDTTVQRRSALRQLSYERLGEQRRTLATTVVMCVDWSRPELDLFQTDDESERPVFRALASPSVVPPSTLSARNTETPSAR